MVVHGKTGTIGGPLVTRGPNKLINQGLIAADEPAGTVTIRTTQFENTGTLAATAANSRLVVRVVPFNNAGTIQELNGGKVLINP